MNDIQLPVPLLRTCRQRSCGRLFSSVSGTSFLRFIRIKRRKRLFPHPVRLVIHRTRREFEGSICSLRELRCTTEPVRVVAHPRPDLSAIGIRFGRYHAGARLALHRRCLDLALPIGHCTASLKHPLVVAMLLFNAHALLSWSAAIIASLSNCGSSQSLFAGSASMICRSNHRSRPLLAEAISSFAISAASRSLPMPSRRACSSASSLSDSMRSRRRSISSAACGPTPSISDLSCSSPMPCMARRRPMRLANPSPSNSSSNIGTILSRGLNERPIAIALQNRLHSVVKHLGHQHPAAIDSRIASDPHVPGDEPAQFELCLLVALFGLCNSKERANQLLIDGTKPTA
ncbi:hypothetical protein p1B351 (plasmid) [Aromatoleum aromaticum EbN1]|uniref:Uncharacterized protein n=1 Tax=Aromatoleum aromaticum (strain DSM 19018 / LMG 30748 / EbN1) TaxID=76114 RepID=Q5NWQ3_AROAE|nr:hypothetical protein p1B351 [Aromatoleum aromaticum EbN1]